MKLNLPEFENESDREEYIKNETYRIMLSLDSAFLQDGGPFLTLDRYNAIVNGVMCFLIKLSGNVHNIPVEHMRNLGIDCISGYYTTLNKYVPDGEIKSKVIE